MRGTRRNMDKVLVNGVEYTVAGMEPPQAAHPQSGFLAITPDIARSWLKHNRNNRNQRRSAYTEQGRDMATGNWDINGETIKVSRPLLMGEVRDVPVGHVLLMDGQHRLEACVVSGRPFVTLVVWGLEPETRRSIDAGKVRTMADILRMEGKVHYAHLATILRRQMMWENGDRRFNGHYKPTKSETLKFLEADPHPFLRAAEQGTWVREKFLSVPATVVGQAYYLTNRVAPDDTPWFFAKFRDGAELATDHPVLALRNRLQNDKVSKKVSVPHQQLAFIVRAWNAYREDRPLVRIQQDVDDPTPDPK